MRLKLLEKQKVGSGSRYFNVLNVAFLSGLITVCLAAMPVDQESWESSCYTAATSRAHVSCVSLGHPPNKCHFSSLGEGVVLRECLKFLLGSVYYGQYPVVTTRLGIFVSVTHIAMCHFGNHSRLCLSSPYFLSSC